MRMKEDVKRPYRPFFFISRYQVGERIKKKVAAAYQYFIYLFIGLFFFCGLKMLDFWEIEYMTILQ